MSSLLQWKIYLWGYLNMDESDKANIIFRMERISKRLNTLNEDFDYAYEVFKTMLKELD